jgi:hypothetical protein
MKSWIGNVALILLVLLLLGGCTIHHQARLYDLETGNVILVDSRIRGNRAIIETVLPSGEHCKGECVTGSEGAVSWGGIYSYYYGSAIYSSTSIPRSQRGIGMMVCEGGITFDCEYQVRRGAIEGYGACRDNRGKYYRLMF